MLPSVTVGIPTRDRAGTIRRAVDSVLAQDYDGDIDIVVVDDGSTDETARILHGYRARIHVVKHESSLGIARAKNAALRAGSGEIRGILDSDDYYLRGFVRRCVETLEANPSVGLVYTDNLLVSDGGRVLERMPALDWDLTRFLETCNMRGDSWMARWPVLEASGLHDEACAMDVDYDLFYRMAPLTGFLRIPEFLHCVVQHAGRVTRRAPESLAFWHAFNLGKYGHDIRHAVARADRFGMAEQWASAITHGYLAGRELAERRAAGKEPTHA